MPRGRIIWLAFEVREDGRVRTVVTRDGNGEPVREPQEFPSVAAAQEAFGGSFREVVEKVLEGGSRKGRWRP